MNLKDKVIIVTGGARGIGRAVVSQLLDKGAVVAAAARTNESLDKLQRELNSSSLHTFQADVGSEEDVLQLFQDVASRCGNPHALVNNAGVGVFKPVEEMTADDWDQQLNVNTRGAFLCAREAFRMMKKDGGQIVNIASNLGYEVREKASAYCASKWALVGFSKTLNQEGRAYDIRVSTVSPGLVQTDFAGVSASEKSSGLHPETVARTIVQTLELQDDAGEMELILNP
ncbi:SDR family oxidoreductase [Alkalicoccus luteus]|uniref:SDR family oxidoreductase n=1 Tax=Alkalicoccus luteus TaxID=1237094 RepID=A0A969TV89_9BACI|nr:SDR family oxidoreductase [Alkalicoccus luteus]NJP36129.1 SDR family oxidoreductase [Alkalicoccus luteus]